MKTKGFEAVMLIGHNGVLLPVNKERLAKDFPRLTWGKSTILWKKRP